MDSLSALPPGKGMEELTPPGAGGAPLGGTSKFAYASPASVDAVLLALSLLSLTGGRPLSNTRILSDTDPLLRRELDLETEEPVEDWEPALALALSFSKNGSRMEPVSVGLVTLEDEDAAEDLRKSRLMLMLGLTLDTACREPPPTREVVVYELEASDTRWSAFCRSSVVIGDGDRRMGSESSSWTVYDDRAVSRREEGTRVEDSSVLIDGVREGWLVGTSASVRSGKFSPDGR